MTAALLPAPNDDSRPLTGGAFGAVGAVRAVSPLTAEKPVRRPYLVPVPDCEPPFDDEAARCPHHGRTDCGTAAPSMPRFEVRHGTWHAPRRAATPERCDEPGVPDGPAPVVTVTPAPPTVGSADHSARLLARALIEVLAGHRPLPQLRSFCTTGVFGALERRGRHPTPSLPHVLSVRVCEPADGIAEVAAVFRRGDRVRMVAFRLERQADRSAPAGGRWTITAVQPG